MTKYVDIYYDKKNKTQRLVLANANDCTAVIQRKLNELNISYTHHQFIGKYKPEEDFKSQTYKYAQKWQWLNTIDLTT